MMSYQLKLLQPKELPDSGVTTSQFKPWVNHLKNFLQQDLENARFMTGGEYGTWNAAIEREDGRRILEIDDNDDDKRDIDAAATAVDRALLKKKLLAKRNAQLSKMIQHIVGFVYYAVANDIDTDSTSLEWVFKHRGKRFQFLETHRHGLQAWHATSSLLQTDEDNLHRQLADER